METVNGDTFISVDVGDFEVQPLHKVADTRGFIYLIKDNAFPDYIKIGRTINMKKRLAIYNSDRPYNTAVLIAISREFLNAAYAEMKILEHLYAHTSPTTLSREWFSNAHEELCLQLIEDAEGAFE